MGEKDVMKETKKRIERERDETYTAKKKNAIMESVRKRFCSSHNTRTKTWPTLVRRTIQSRVIEEQTQRRNMIKLCYSSYRANREQVKIR